MQFILQNETGQELHKFELTQKQIEYDFVYELEKAVAALLNLAWTHVFLDGMNESITPLDMFNSRNIFELVITNKKFAKEYLYKVLKINA